MLREIRYEIGMQRGYEYGQTDGVSQGTLKTAVIMVKEFSLSIEEVADKLNISVSEIKQKLSQDSL